MLENLLTQLEQNDPALTELDISFIPSTREEVITFLLELPKALKNNNHLMKLRLTNKYYNVCGKKLRNILEVLQTNICLTELDLNTNDMMDGEDIEAIAQLLEKNTCLTTLNLKSNAIGDSDTDISTIITALIKNKNTHLTRLNFYDNKIGNASAGAIADLLKEQHCPTALDLGQNRITDKGARLIAKALETNAKIEELYLRLNRIGSQGAEALALAIKNNPNIPLWALDVSCNEIKVEGATAIAGMLEKNICLEELNLFNNEIGDAGIEAIAEALAENAQSPLSILKLSYNEIGDAGAKAIARMLVVNKTLTRLDLSNNQISDEGIEAITEAAKGHPCLKMLHLGSNKISTQGAKAIAKMMAENSHLEVLTLSRQSDLSRTFDIGQEGLAAIVEALKNNQHLKKLDLENNNLGDEGAKCIAELLAENTSLTHVNLEYNDIGYEGLKAIAEAMENNKNILELNIIHRSMTAEPSPYIGNDSEGPACLLAIEKCLERNRRLQNPSIVIPGETKTEKPRDFIQLLMNLEKVPNNADGYYYNPKEEIPELTDLDLFDKRRILLYKAQLELYLEIKFGKALDAIVVENAAKEDGAESGTLMDTIAKMLYGKRCTSSEAIEGLTALSKESPKDKVYADKMIAVIQAHYANLDNVEVFINKQLSNVSQKDEKKLTIEAIEGLTALSKENPENKVILDKMATTLQRHNTALDKAEVFTDKYFSNVSRRELEEKQTKKTSVVEEQKSSKVSPNFTKASALIGKNKDASVLEEEKSAKFPWGLALLLLVIGLGGVIGLAVTGLFFSLWTIIPAAVFLIGVGMGVKALYDAYQQRQRAYQKSLLIPDDEHTDQDKEQNQLKNSYQIKRLKAEEASGKLRKILENKGLDFKKAEATINVLGYDEGEFYLTYESLTSLFTEGFGYGDDKEGEAEFQKGWRLVQELVKDNPSKRELPYDNCIVIEVDTVLNMDLKNSDRSLERKEHEGSVDDSLHSVTSAQNKTTFT